MDTLDTCYKLQQSMLAEQGGISLLKSYGGSLRATLVGVYPDHDWKPLARWWDKAEHGPKREKKKLRRRASSPEDRGALENGASSRVQDDDDGD